MAEIYRSSLMEPSTESSVLVLHCSDMRYQPHFQNFLRQGLQLERYALIAVPGGIQLLTREDYLPKFAWAGWRWVKFMVNLMQPERLVLIAHDDCRWYFKTYLGLDAVGMRELQSQDLQRIREGLTKRFGIRRIEVYFARLENGQAVFETV